LPGKYTIIFIDAFHRFYSLFLFFAFVLFKNTFIFITVNSKPLLMKKSLPIALALFFAYVVSFAQEQKKYQHDFNDLLVLKEAQRKGVLPADYKGYIENAYRKYCEAHNVSQPHQVLKAYPTSPPHVNSLNFDFENGDFTGWSVYHGMNTVNSNGPLTNVVPAPQIGPTDTIACMNDRVSIMSAAYGNDPQTGIPLQSPLGGNFVARLNGYCAAQEASYIEQSFTPSPSESQLNYAYAVILEDGGHMPGEQSYFSASIFDAMGNPIPCCQVYMQAANGTTPGFYPVINGNAWTYYKPWTPVSVDLTPYIGQTLTVRFLASGCIYAGHSGYAYVDANLSPNGATFVPNVWPGDANYDLTCDLNDLLYVGWAFGANGSTRPSASNNWNAEVSNDWGMMTAYGTEFKHADCNGDGTIDLNDTLAIQLNYNLTHPFRYGSVPGKTSGSMAVRALSVTGPATVGSNQNFQIAVGLISNPLVLNDSIYGISFQLAVPGSYLSQMNASDFSSNFLGVNGSDMITMCKPNVAGNYVDVCMVKRNKQNTVGGGTLSSLSFQSSSFMGTANGLFEITNVRAITYGGQYIPIAQSSHTVNFDASVGVVAAMSLPELKVHPNPAKNQVFVSGIQPQTKIEVLNALGEVICCKSISNNESIDISSLSNGTYFLRIQTTEKNVFRKFIKE
jgi:hypothetical protein